MHVVARFASRAQGHDFGMRTTVNLRRAASESDAAATADDAADTRIGLADAYGAVRQGQCLLQPIAVERRQGHQLDG